ncbi:MAG: PAS domain S-box protein [Deltaproteobacteria bacterium]|nr:PAS domain S-box protein [Deltaproteobacteria bacterium]
MEQRQGEREEKSRSVFENAVVGFYQSTPEGRFIQVNPALARMLKYASPEELISEVTDIGRQAYVNSEDRRRFQQLLYDQGYVENFEFQARCKDGSHIWVSSSTRAYVAPGGTPIQYEGIVIDITDRKRVEEKLKAEKVWSEAIVSAAPNIIIGLGQDSRILLFNRFAERLTGYTAQEVMGKEWIEIFILKESQEEFRGVWKEILRDNLVQHHYENPIIIKTGEQRLISWNNTVLLENGRFKMVLSIGEDITERRRAEEALKESEKKFRELFDSITDLVYTQDMEGRFLTVNPALYKLFGYSTDEFIGRRGADFIKPELRPLFYSEYLEGIKKEGRFEGISAYYKKDGGKIYIEYKSKLVQPENGPPYISGIGRDVTDRILMEREREKLQQQLLQAQKMESVGRLAGGVAHDFNNMLGVIQGRTEMMLMEMQPGDPYYAELEEIQKAAQRSADLTRQLLAFARRQTITPKILDINNTVEGILKMLRRLIGEDIDLVWEPGADLWPVKMDPAQIDQILANLCVNAREAIAGTGKITIKTENALLDAFFCDAHEGCQPGQYVLLSVTDDGCGIDEATQARIFEPFFTTREVGEGTGLGLATVYGIVKQNNGFVRLHSEIGKGSVFRVYIPRHEGSVVKEAAPDAEQIPDGRGETILLVEDDPSILQMGRVMLERLGYTVLHAATPSQALEIAKAHHGKFHLLVTDVVMPRMSGYTANIIAHRGILDEAVHFIQKPFTLKELAVKVREALES